ncbi:MAG: HEPN domain-containing protein [Candidatus Micrarchaeota archaeon]
MIDGLVREGNLVKTRPDSGKAIKSLDLAKNKISKAETEYGAGIFDNAVVSAYTSMFHAARALLFRDGFKEKNHYAVCRYLKEAYGNRIEKKYVTELNTLRTIRHKVIYGDENIDIKEVQMSEAESSIEMARGFLESVKKIIL